MFEMPCIASTPEYIEIADKMAHDISERFTPDEQNEMLRRMYNIIKERRLAQLSEIEARCNHLQESIKGLNFLANKEI